MMGASRQLAPRNGRASSLSTRPRLSTRGAPRCVRGVTANPWRSASHSPTGCWSAPCARTTCCFSSRALLCRWHGLVTPSPRAGPKRLPPTPQRLALRRTHRAQLPPFPPPSPTMRALDQLGAHRRRVVRDTGRNPHRLTRTLTNYFPPGLPWFQAKAPPIFCDVLRRWPPSKRPNSHAAPP